MATFSTCVSARISSVACKTRICWTAKRNILSTPNPKFHYNLLLSTLPTFCPSLLSACPPCFCTSLCDATLSSFFLDGKYHLLPTGELLVHNLEYSDQFPPFRCRTMHRLTRQVVVSSPANVRVTGESQQGFAQCLVSQVSHNRNLSSVSSDRHETAVCPPA